MGRIIALAAVSAIIWWLWKRWQNQIANPNSESKSRKKPTQKLAQCVRCDAMLPSDQQDRQEVARSCDQGTRCPLRSEQD